MDYQTIPQLHPQTLPISYSPSLPLSLSQNLKTLTLKNSLLQRRNRIERKSNRQGRFKKYQHNIRLEMEVQN